MEWLRYANPAAASEYPLAGAVTSGLTVGTEIDNTSSIGASLLDYEVLRGIREVPLSDFHSAPHQLFYAADDIQHAKLLAEAINRSGRIDPLIVVVDQEGPYILEGAHRLAALHLLKKRTFPALVVRDLEDS